ncbi:putative diguanylate cyclase DgcT [Burkholderiales bacterium]|nr:putative diguanylate cyclase DgcT [Burkholderiales bacterium]
MDRLDTGRLTRALWPYVALWTAVTVIVAAVTAFQIAESRERELAQGRAEAENLARVLQDHTARTLDGFDRALSLLKTLHERGVGDALLKPLSASLVHTMSTEVERTFNRFDRQGTLVATSARERPAGTVSIGDRAYFADVRDRPGESLRIGEPNVGRVSGHAVIPLVKRLETADGSFDGVIAVALDPARLVHLFRSLRVGETSSVGLIDRSGRVYVWSENQGVARPATAGTSPVTVPLRVDTQTDATDLRIEDIAGPDSVVATSAVPGTRLLAFAALSEAQILAEHRIAARNLVGYAALIVLMLTVPIVLVALRAIREIRRRRALERRYEDARERARTDPLTGVANREAFDDHLRHLHAAAAGGGAPFVLAFLDVDRFKALNDRYGHETGDRALRRIGDMIAGSVRRADIVARMGGDEFAVLMPGADRDSCVRAFDCLRETLALAVREEGWPITFSIGVVAYESVPARARDTVSLADRLMYEVKAAGGDGVRYATFRKGRLSSEAPRQRLAA